MLEQLEELDDLKALKTMRRKPLTFKRLEDFLSCNATMQHALLEGGMRPPLTGMWSLGAYALAPWEQTDSLPEVDVSRLQDTGIKALFRQGSFFPSFASCAYT